VFDRKPPVVSPATRALAAAQLAVLLIAPLGVLPLIAARTPPSARRLAAAPADLRRIAAAYYDSVKVNFPVGSSGQGLHTWDDRLTDYRPDAIEARRAYVRRLLAQIRAIDTTKWSRDDQVDWVLFRSQLEAAEFFNRVQDAEHVDPQTYVNEISNGIFSLLTKDYAPARQRALAATARLRATPAMLRQGEANLTKPVSLYAKLAIDAARGGDELYTVSLMTLAKDLSPAERAALVSARDSAVAALHSYADWLAAREKSMPPWRAMGTANYEYMLHHIYLLPMSADQLNTIGQTELARYRSLEAMLPDPRLANPDPARAPRIPKDQADFLKTYQAREKEVIDFINAKKLVTLPSYIGPFYIRQLPEAFKPTSPGGFMNPPGLYDKDSSGFYFIPTYDPKSNNFYIRAGIEDPRPLIVHEGFPGHFVQLSIANHLPDEIRRQQGDGVFTEGWALYLEEVVLHEGLIAQNTGGHGQVLRLSRYRAARVGVDANLHTGKWTFDQAVQYFMNEGGLDHEAAEGEAAGAASQPTQKMTYIVGKLGFMRLLGRYRDAHPNDFRLGAFHDQVISYGSLPQSVVEWLMFNDPTAVKQATRQDTL
jgi:uncharacterized protein (DUF885 family)